MKNATISLEICKDIFDWFDDKMLEEITNRTDLGDGYEDFTDEELEKFSAHAAELVYEAIGTEEEYPWRREDE